MADQRTLRVVIVGNASQAQQALQNLGTDAEQAGGQIEGIGGRFQGMKAGLMGAAAGIAAALPAVIFAGFQKGFEEIGNRAKLSAQLGLKGPDAAKAGKLAGDLYVSGFGESTADAGEVVKRVSQDLNKSVNDVDFKPIAKKVAALSETFDLEVGGITNAVSQMLKNGLAKNADEAFDLITKGMQNGANKADDLLDTINEYSPQFKKMGLDGKLAMGMITQAVKGGARDSDNVADAIKEFSLRAVDGSKTTSDAFKRLGIDAKDFVKEFTKGGAEGQAALDKVFDKLRTLKGDDWQNTVTELFGGPGEDLGAAINDIDPSKAVQALGQVKGAAKDMADTMHNNASAKVTQFKRKLEMGFTDAFANIITEGGKLKSKLGPVLGQLKNTVGPAVAPIREGLSGIWDSVSAAGRDLLGWIRSDIAPMFREIWAQWGPTLNEVAIAIGQYLQKWKMAFDKFVAGVKWLWNSGFGKFLIDTIKKVFEGIRQFVEGGLEFIRGVWDVFAGLFTGDWKRVWQGIRQIFSGAWKMIVGAFKVYIYGSIVGILRGGVVRLLTLWKGGLSAVRGFFTSIWNGIRAFFTTKIRQLTVAASNGAAGIRRFFSTHFASMVTTVRDKIVTLYGYIRAIPGRVKGFFSGLPGTMRGIGRNIIEGLVNGIRSAWGAVTATVDSLIDKIPGPIRKALGIHSPSKVMADIGKWIVAGLVKGMKGGTKSVQKTSDKLHDLITKAFKNKAISKKKAMSLHKWVTAQNKRLKTASAAREKITARLTAANAKLADLKKSKADMASSIRDKARDYGSFMGVYDSSEYGDNSANAMLGRLKEKLKGIIDFRKNLQTLAKRGLGKGIINEIAQAGPEEGGKMAQALLNAGTAQIKEFNATYNAIGSQASSLGNWSAGNYYNAGIQATEGLIRGLKSRESKLNKAIEKMATSMVKTLKKKLGIKSPSRVFRAQGQFTGDGFALGVEDRQKDVQKAVDSLAGTRPTGRLANRSIAVEKAAATAASRWAPPVVNVTVQGNVTAEKALARSIATTVRDEIVRNGKRNGGRTGL
ncbi:phage tail tape measure protein [Streptomyces cellulosae]